MPLNPDSPTDWGNLNIGLLRTRYKDYADLLSTVRLDEGADSCSEGPPAEASAIAPDVSALLAPAPAVYICIRPECASFAGAFAEALERRDDGSVAIFAEDRLEHFKRALETSDWSAVLTSTRTVLVLGAVEAVAEFLMHHPAVASLPLSLVTPPGFDRARALDLLTLAHNRGVTATESLVRFATDAVSKRRVAGSAPRILLAGTEWGYLINSVADGLRSCGAEVELMADTGSLPRRVEAQSVLAAILRVAPDLVLWGNRPEVSGPASAILRGTGASAAVWCFDNPVRMGLAAKDLEPCDATFVFDAAYCRHLAAAPHEINVLALAAGLRPPRAEAASCHAVAGAVTFVGSLGTRRIAALRNRLRAYAPELLLILDELVDVADTATEFERRTGMAYRGAFCMYVEESKASRWRAEALMALCAAPLRIFGEPEWGNIPKLRRAYAGGPIAYGPDLSAVYRDAAINLNLFHPQCVNSTNSRVYDVLAAGGFLLSEHRACLEVEFEIDRHLVTFHSLQEAAQKVHYYLEHPAEREEIARAGQLHVLAKHTFEQRCRRLLKIIGWENQRAEGSPTWDRPSHFARKDSCRS